MAFLDPLRPPGEARGGADEITAVLQGDTAPSLRVLQVVEISEMTIDQHRVGQLPEVLGGLQLRGIGRQKEQVDLLGHTQSDARVPAGLVEHEHDLLVGARSRLLSEGGQLDLKELNAHGGGEVEAGAAGGGMHNTDEPAPGEAVLDEGMRARTGRRPDPASERFEADAMVIGRPQFHRGLGKRGRHRS